MGMVDSGAAGHRVHRRQRDRRAGLGDRRRARRGRRSSRSLRIARKRPVTQAIAGVFGVGIAAFIAYRTDSAKGYFLLGIWSYLLYGGALLLSDAGALAADRASSGRASTGAGTAWRSDRRWSAATTAPRWSGSLVFALRYLVQNYLYDTDQVGWLAVFRVAMGYPLFVVAGLATVWIVAGTTAADARGGLRQGLAGWPRGAPPAATRRGRKPAGRAARSTRPP